MAGYFYFGGVGFIILVCIIICIIRARRAAYYDSLPKPQTVVIAAPEPVPMNPYGAAGVNPAGPAAGLYYPYQQPQQPYPAMQAHYSQPDQPYPPQTPYQPHQTPFQPHQTPFQQPASAYPPMQTPLVQPAPAPAPAMPVPSAAPVSTFGAPSEGVFSPPPAYSATPSLQPAPPVPFPQSAEDAKRTGYSSGGQVSTQHYAQGSGESSQTRAPQGPQAFV
ncbi:MAG: hypothetical protein J3Q66DRAFT_336301 [Benniella sp.]|nr:MAG: hypothetical protein J3Q66DRAFT_336301 [Benniella sp.]